MAFAEALLRRCEERGLEKTAMAIVGESLAVVQTEVAVHKATQWRRARGRDRGTVVVVYGDGSYRSYTMLSTLGAEYSFVDALELRFAGLNVS